MAGTSKTRPYNAVNAGALSIAECEITFSAADARVLLVEGLPANSLIVDAFFDLTEAFDSGTSDTLSIGTGATGGANDGDILDTVDGQGTPGVFPATRSIPKVSGLSGGEDVYAYYNTEGTAPSAGAAKAYIVYARLADNG